MRFRRLRIAWSVFWALACVLLVVLWVRSYWLGTAVRIPFSDYVWVQGSSQLGWIRASGYRVRSTFPGIAAVNRGFDYRTGRLKQPLENVPNWTTWIGVLCFSRPEFVWVWELQIPLWLPPIPTAVLAIAPWLRQIRWRFRLRTLLIATTLVAVALGLIVWLR
jgi:hypothetical protein